MRNRPRRRAAPAWLRLAAVGVMLLGAGCAQQRIRDGAETAMRAGQYEEALSGVETGLKQYPDSALLRAGLLEMRIDAVTRLASEAAAARAQGRSDQAEQTLRRALILQPGNARIEAMLSELATERRQRAALADAETLVAQRKPEAALRLVHEALKSNPRQADLLALARRLEIEQRQAQVRSAQLGLAEARPISLDFRDANLRTVLDVVSRNSGINFIFDKDIRPDTRVTVYLRSAKVEDAIDLITSTYQLAKKVIDSRTLLIYPNTAEKQREHQEQVVKVFYLGSGEAKGAAAFLRSMLKIREPYVDERTNMLAVRDSQENVQLAERLIALYDTSEPEVLLEVEVIEVRTSRLTELGVKLPDTFSLTVLPPAAEDGLTLANIRGLTRDRIGFSIGGATVNLKRETGDFNTLANPRIRVRNKEKAKILVGDKVPVVSVTTGQAGFVSDSVSYLDVGLKLDVEPTVSIDDEVAIRIALEVSSLGSAIKTSSGTLAYQIGTRNASTLLRLRDGETQLLAGLISTEDRSDASRVPGVGDLPMLGRLFSNTRDDTLRTELVLSITPRILRNIRRPDAAESELWVGTEAFPRLRPVGGVRTVDAAAGSSLRVPAAAVQAAPTSTVPTSAATTASPTKSGLALQWTGPEKVKAGESFVLALTLNTDQPLRGAPLQVGFDKDRFELLGVEEGAFFRRDGATTGFTKSVDATTGRITVGVLRNTSTGVSGQSDLISIRLKPLTPGAADVAVFELSPIGVEGPVPRPTVLPTMRVQVQ